MVVEDSKERWGLSLESRCTVGESYRKRSSKGGNVCKGVCKSTKVEDTGGSKSYIASR